MTKQRTQLIALLFCVAALASAQTRNYAVHSRGMLHQSVFNTGELGRTYDGGTAGVQKDAPSFEWPGNSDVIVDSKEYPGQHNSFGGGMYLAVNRTDSASRIYAYCGAINSIPVYGTSSFPLGLHRFENFPVLADGSLNPAYVANEAEEKIVSRWATPTGITVTRTSRAWSAPDYDDFIIYEYELENTGDIDGNSATPALHDTLREVLIGFGYGFAPGMFGYQRKYNRWDGTDYQNNDLYARFDRRRWLNYALDRDGKPEQQYFTDWAANEKNGGGLLAPQAVGFMPLYFDTTHLAHESETHMIVASSDQGNVWDADLHLKQPYLNRVETTNLTKAKIDQYLDILQTRKNNPYLNPIFGPDWIGRGAFNVRQSQYFGTGRILVFGPYILKPGEKLRFTIAEVAGYGAARLAGTRSGITDEGGSCGQNCGESASANAFNPVPNWTDTVQYGPRPTVFGSRYLSTYPLPQYVNSGVVTIRDVADRAIQAYTGKPLADYDSLQYWPEAMNPTGVYAVPVPVPAPSIRVENTALAENKIIWGRQVESFSSTALEGTFSHYELQKSSHPLGKWITLDSIAMGDSRYFVNGEYQFVDKTTRVGESYFYSVVSVETNGKKSGRTNITLHQTQLGGTEILGKVYAVPNPFIVQSGFSGTTPSGIEAKDKIGFYNLPKHCTIRILSYSGQLVETLHHDDELYSTEYFRVTRNNQVIASGVYFFVVETPEGMRTHGKFVVIQ